MVINDIADDDGFSKSGNRRSRGSKESKNNDKNKIQRPSKIKKEEIALLGLNPFKKQWMFPANLSFDRIIIPNDQGKRASKTLYAASMVELNNFKAKQYAPFFLEGSSVRLYLSGNAGFRDILFNLDSSSHTLFIWVIYHLEHGHSFALLNRQLLIGQGKPFSKNTFYKARKQLIDNEIIAPTNRDDYYWVNIQYFFRGNRCNYFPECASVDGLTDLDEMKERQIKSTEKIVEGRLKRLKRDSEGT
jgi:hypothetical protein